MPAATVPERPTRVPTSPRQSAPLNPEIRSATRASTFTAPGVRERPAAIRKVLLGCGVLSSILYVVLVSLPYDGYDVLSQINPRLI